MTIYIFGYGALLNTVKEIEEPRKHWPVVVKGLKRSLNVRGRRHRVFGVKAVPSAFCNGLLIKINAAELAQLQEREKLYTMTSLAKERVFFPYDQRIQFQPADQIIYFYPQTKYVVPFSSKPSAYVRKCKAGAAAISDIFLQDFLNTTDH